MTNTLLTSAQETASRARKARRLVSAALQLGAAPGALEGLTEEGWLKLAEAADVRPPSATTRAAAVALFLMVNDSGELARALLSLPEVIR